MSSYTSPITGRSYRIPDVAREQVEAWVKPLQERVAREGDAAIDCSDIPEITEEQATRAIRPGRQPRVPGGTVLVNTRIDADVIDWLKRDGPGYQTRLNAILRRAYESAPTT